MGAVREPLLDGLTSNATVQSMAETDLTADAERASKRIVDQLAQLEALPEGG
jgi:hypothetical protein